MNDVPPPPPPPYGSPPPGTGAPDVGTALSYGFNKYFANVGPVLAVIFVPVVAQLGSLFGLFVLGCVIFGDACSASSASWSARSSARHLPDGA